MAQKSAVNPLTGNAYFTRPVTEMDHLIGDRELCEDLMMGSRARRAAALGAVGALTVRELEHLSWVASGGDESTIIHDDLVAVTPAEARAILGIPRVLETTRRPRPGVEDAIRAVAAASAAEGGVR
jgi:hypothetical protein